MKISEAFIAWTPRNGGYDYLQNVGHFLVTDSQSDASSYGKTDEPWQAGPDATVEERIKRIRWLVAHIIADDGIAPDLIEVELSKIDEWPD